MTLATETNARPTGAVSAHREFYAEVVKGLSGAQKALPCKYFYDERGSRLFEAICQTPEYYPTRTEIGLLRVHAAEIARFIGDNAHLVDLGSGSSAKVRVLLNSARLASYIPLDISGLYLMRAAYAVASDYRDLHVAPVCADFTAPFQLPSVIHTGGRVVGFFPGSTIGNFAPAEAKSLLRRFGSTLGSGSGLIVGVDLKKDRRILDAAYNDAAGITAAFNLNLLRRINRELDADFDTQTFVHRARYNAAKGRIEMHLQSTDAQIVHIGSAAFSFAAGETIHTENSYKYDAAEFQALAASAGYTSRAVWVDAEQLFSIHYLTLDN